MWTWICWQCLYGTFLQLVSGSYDNQKNYSEKVKTLKKTLWHICFFTSWQCCFSTCLSVMVNEEPKYNFCSTFLVWKLKWWATSLQISLGWLLHFCLGTVVHLVQSSFDTVLHSLWGTLNLEIKLVSDFITVKIVVHVRHLKSYSDNMNDALRGCASHIGICTDIKILDWWWLIMTMSPVDILLQEPCCIWALPPGR